MMPKSAKGGGRNRSAKKTERYSVPITVQLAAKLRAAAQGPRRPCAAAAAERRQPLGRQSRRRTIIAKSNKIVTAIGLDPAAVTMYALRHSSIVAHAAAERADQAGGVAAQHQRRDDRADYSKYITEHSDGVSRKALLQLPVGDTVAALAS